MAVDRVEKLLRKVSKALGKAGILYAVVGGNAVAAWVATVDEGAVRATKNVDLLVRRGDLYAIAEAVHDVGLMPAEVLGVHMLVDRRRPNPKTAVHLILAGELIRPYDEHPAPDLKNIVQARGGFKLLGLPELLRMKLSAFRRVDKVHIVDILSTGMITAAIERKLPPDLRERLNELKEERA